MFREGAGEEGGQEGELAIQGMSEGFAAGIAKGEDIPFSEIDSGEVVRVEEEEDGCCFQSGGVGAFRITVVVVVDIGAVGVALAIDE